ncbi:hypothetical protein [Streptomyces sp. RFCAC02]|uniref:hypothetical protein n=1 Tax=Streptomyces sp. RFCAC02 TaxID=2499143 RepID=UPI00102063AB|nr:hypothetical protein [Streptomyces sp. RFCAC02]
MNSGAIGRKPSTEAYDAALLAVDELSAALKGVDLALPSLGVDLVSATSRFSTRPLIELGRCNLETALELAAVLRVAGAVKTGEIG